MLALLHFYLQYFLILGILVKLHHTQYPLKAPVFYERNQPRNLQRISKKLLYFESLLLGEIEELKKNVVQKSAHGNQS